MSIQYADIVELWEAAKQLIDELDELERTDAYCVPSLSTFNRLQDAVAGMEGKNDQMAGSPTTCAEGE